jgi:hypothetical protein
MFMRGCGKARTNLAAVYGSELVRLNAGTVSGIGLRPAAADLRPVDAGTDAIRSRPVFEGAVLGEILWIPEAESSLLFAG